ncbi:MAG: hypothetical protein HQ518_04700, partial [Rhodopirellula sp.]|nr:hypothetical protein [Rhodopirellula sp.]
MRDRILRHLGEIHSSDPEVEEAAWDQLRKLRIPDEQLELARLLKHPDQRERLRLAGLLDSATEPLRSELQLELTRDSDRDVRELMLRRFSKNQIPDRVASRLKEMSTSDPDLKIRKLAAELATAQPARNEQIRLASLVDDVGVPPAPNAGNAAAEAPPQVSTQDFDEQLRGLEAITGREPGEFPLSRSPEILDRPIEQQITPSIVPAMAQFEELLIPERDPPRGFTGPSGILPTEQQQDSHFVPMPDRWRTGYPRVDRYGLGYPYTVDYIGTEGHWWDPYNQNVLKGDYPIIGQHTFLNVTATSQTQ